MTMPSDVPTADVDLLRRMSEGDRAAFAEFYDRFSRPLFATAVRIVNDRAEAEDILHDAFVTMWEKAASYEPSRGSPFAWAVTLVRNRAIDRVRSRRRRSEILSASAATDVSPAAEAENRSADEQAAAGDDSSAVRTALASLSPDQQKAVELAFFSGLTQEEIARSLNEPLGTVKARIRRGLLKLRDLLASRP